MKNLPKVIADLVRAQDQFDSEAYANCFTESAVVVDEGKTHIGKTAIRYWIEKANTTYQVSMKPIAYSEATQTLQAQISGSFPGSPLVLTYEFDMIKEQIQSLKIG